MKKMPEVVRMEEALSFDYQSNGNFHLNFKTNYGFIRSLCIKGMVDDVNNYADNLKRYKNFVQVGIGGSALGATASIEFLQGIYHNLENEKKYFVLDNIDPERMKFILSLDFKDTVFHIVSKSGQTTETISQFLIIYEKVKESLGKDADRHFIFTTGKSGFLRDFGKEHKIDMFNIPDEVGGRYSIFTPVALVPLAFLGFDIDSFIEGAKVAVRAYRNGWSTPNDFAEFAVGECKNGRNMLVFFAYKDRLLSLADWFRQLWAESLGKDGKGQTPIKALGVTDQHSQLQLYQDGPKDKAFVFLDSVNLIDFEVKEGYLKGRKLGEIMETEKISTIKALTEHSVNCTQFFINKIDEFHLGAFCISLMIATAKSGEILNVNPFNQPGVELGKKYTKEALGL